MLHSIRTAARVYLRIKIGFSEEIARAISWPPQENPASCCFRVSKDRESKLFYPRHVLCRLFGFPGKNLIRWLEKRQHHPDQMHC
jgi:hypothetical protein